MTSIVEQAAAIGMSEEQINAIMGSLLGDASLRKSSDHTQSIRWNHGQVQEDYVIHKYEVLQEFATRPPFVTENPGYGDFWVVLTLKALPIFHSLYTLMRPEGSERKTVTVEYLNEITHPIALAWWFMDDGSRGKDRNGGAISTNSFSEEEVNLLCQWLTVRWGIEAKPCMVKHSSTGNLSHIILLPRNGYITLANLISPFVPECMQYKVKVVEKTCPNCGKLFTVNGSSPCCSKECREAYAKANKHEYYLEYRQQHLEEILAKAAAYRETHREQLRAAGAAYRANLTEEQKAHRAAQMAAWQKANRDHINAVKREWRQSKKGDPEYKAQLKEERSRYYQRKKQDPERYQRTLELQKIARQKPERKAQEKAYRAKRDAMKLINEPEEFARRICWRDMFGKMKSMKREQQLEFIHIYAIEHAEERLKMIQEDPVAWALYQQMQSGLETSSSTES